jgi:hypothetical protein
VRKKKTLLLFVFELLMYLNEMSERTNGWNEKFSRVLWDENEGAHELTESEWMRMNENEWHEWLKGTKCFFFHKFNWVSSRRIKCE